MRAVGRFVAVVWIGVSMAAADERVNPFSRPAEGAARAASVARDPDQLMLRGILWANGGSLVDVDGTIIGLGEEVYGYVLAAVEEGSATFVKDKKTFTLNVMELEEGE